MRRRGPLRDDLAAQLAADRAAGPGHQHDLARDVAREQRRVERHRIAAEQVGDVDLAQVGDCDSPVHQIEQACKDFHRQPGVPDLRDQLALLRRRRRWNRQHDLRDVVAENGLR